MKPAEWGRIRCGTVLYANIKAPGLGPRNAVLVVCSGPRPVSDGAVDLSRIPAEDAGNASYRRCRVVACESGRFARELFLGKVLTLVFVKHKGFQHRIPIKVVERSDLPLFMDMAGNAEFEEIVKGKGTL
jgi:hypothetical protein